MIRVLLADDHPAIVEGLLHLFQKYAEIAVVGTVNNGTDLLNLTAVLTPDVIITDIDMPGLETRAVSEEIVNTFPLTSMIVYSLYDKEYLIADFMQAGVLGYVLKSDAIEDLVTGLHKVYNGECYYSPTIRKKAQKIMLNPKQYISKKGLFTDKEVEVIRLLYEEKTSDEIGKEIYSAKRTIDGLRRRIMEKMKVRSVQGILKYAIEHGLFDRKG
ncbi:MAG: response regulator transcription factor [Segetibacter sp.]|jgi:two-component system response regulator NreC|nr:response regulator transcription factor [Segetibacter sp.]